MHKIVDKRAIKVIKISCKLLLKEYEDLINYK